LDLTTFLDLEKDVKNDVNNLFGIQFFYLLFSPSIGCGPKAPHVFLGFLPQRIWLGLAISLESIHGGTANGVFRSSKNVEIGGKNHVINPYGSKHCLRRYLSLQIIVNYTPNTSLRRYLDP